MKIGTQARAGLSRKVRAAAGVVVAAPLLALSGCGGGSGSSSAGLISSPTVSSASTHDEDSRISFLFTSDNYGMENATYLSATRSGGALILRAAVAGSMADPDYRTVSRIDIPDAGALAGGVYSLGATTPGVPAFPGSLSFFNGHQSTLLQTVGGTITFTSYGSDTGSTISGSFQALVLDGGDSAVPQPTYTVAGSFGFVSGSCGPILPAPVPVPAAAASLYRDHCASCHSLGAFDPAPGSGPDLALKGGKLDPLFPAGAPGHQGLRLASADLAAVKILLNVN